MILRGQPERRETMFDHVGLNVRDFERSRFFYRHALQPLGLLETAAFEESKAAAFGTEGSHGFWIAQREPYGTGTHVAFTAPDRVTVDAFHMGALAAGGTDNGEPGIREQYHPTYYAAFVLDPDGNNVEAVCHKG
jgi:catechol 2,3-dioxygenase-like lactoylglutathione lyase family enzyme